jgi:hypothetical protein
MFPIRGNCAGPDRIAFSGADHLNSGNSMVLIVFDKGHCALQFDGHVMRISKGSLLLGLRRQLGSVVRLRPAVYSAKHLLKLGFIRHYGELKSMDV